MYLNKVIVENNGLLKKLNITPSFTKEGNPTPLILVGGNGAGKTNLLSLVADALFEAAAVHHDNVLPANGMRRSWFRVVGGGNVTVGASGSFSLLRFDDAGTALFYKEKAGQVDAAEVSQRVPYELTGDLNWPKEGSFKEFSIQAETSERLFREGVYTYFPSNRAEIPYWLNREVISETQFDVVPSYSSRLRKPIYVDRTLDRFKQWVIGLITDVRADIGWNVENDGLKLSILGNPLNAILTLPILEKSNKILQLILDDEEVRFAWLGRRSPDKVAVSKGGNLIYPNLDVLSVGQSILLGMFGTILRYGDINSEGLGINVSSLEGICLVDEIDAHIHIELQHKVLPKLIQLFPKIQFIVSSHSPLFVLGMEKAFGAEGVQIVEMPSGIPVGAETYAEFGRALEVLSATGSFTERVLAEAGKQGCPIVYVEGETDAPYLKKAIKLLGRESLLDRCETEWIGSKDKNGQGFHTGKEALKHTLAVLKANPDLSRRQILLLYDNDVGAVEEDCLGVSVRRMPSNEDNKKVKAGIENLLPEKCIEEKFYDKDVKCKPNGSVVTMESLNKNKLCIHMCSNGTAIEFEKFGDALDVIESCLDKLCAVKVESGDVRG